MPRRIRSGREKGPCAIKLKPAGVKVYKGSGGTRKAGCSRTLTQKKGREEVQVLGLSKRRGKIK